MSEFGKFQDLALSEYECQATRETITTGTEIARISEAIRLNVLAPAHDISDKHSAREPHNSMLRLPVLLQMQVGDVKLPELSTSPAARLGVEGYPSPSTNNVALSNNERSAANGIAFFQKFVRAVCFGKFVLEPHTASIYDSEYNTLVSTL